MKSTRSKTQRSTQTERQTDKSILYYQLCLRVLRKIFISFETSVEWNLFYEEETFFIELSPYLSEVQTRYSSFNNHNSDKN